MISIYSKAEEGFMRRTQELKARMLTPLLRSLTMLGIDANMVSFASGAVALLGLNEALSGGEKIFFLAGIWLHFFLDGVDGALARFQNRGSELGTLYDLLADSSGIILTGIFLTLFYVTSGALAALFVGSYLCVNAFSYFLSQRDEHYPFVLRPRVFVYAALVIDFIFKMQLTRPIVFVSYLILGYFSFVGLELIFSKRPQ